MEPNTPAQEPSSQDLDGVKIYPNTPPIHNPPTNNPSPASISETVESNSVGYTILQILGFILFLVIGFFGIFTWPFIALFLIIYIIKIMGAYRTKGPVAGRKKILELVLVIIVPALIGFGTCLGIIQGI